MNDSGHLVNDIKQTLTRLATVLKDDHSEKKKDDEELRIADDAFNKLSDNITEDEDTQSMFEYRDILKQNNDIKRELVLLQQQLVEKDERIRMLEKLLGQTRETHL